MNFVDATLLRLATPAERNSLFDDDALAQLVATAYDADALAIEGPYQPHFDDLRLGPSIPPVATAEGAWQQQTNPTERTDVSVRVSGLAGAPTQRVDALWRGGIVAHMIPLDSTIDEARVGWPDPGLVDAEIIAADGSLPSNKTTLENKRRARLMDHLKAGLAEPEALTDERFDTLLASIGASTVSDLIERIQSSAAVGTVTITFSSPTAAQPTPKELPVAVAVLIRDAAGFSLADLLADSHALRERLDPLAVERPSDPTLRVRNRVVVAWVVPETIFDDDDWPGAADNLSPEAKRDARRAAAGQWLAAEGIGLVPIAA